MPFDRVTGQHHAKAQISAWLTHDRLPHTILIAGPAGVGKRDIAIELARAVNCRQRQADACGECPSCLKMATLAHRDLHVLLPLPTSTQRGDENRALANLRETGLEYVQQHLSLSHSSLNISRENIRLLQRDMSYAPTEARKRIGIVFEADCMLPAGANSLLKILEEPPRHAIFLIVTSAPDRLLPTVVSRCQRLDLRPLKTVELANSLRDKGVDPERALLAARHGRGSLHKALAVVEDPEGFEERRQRVEQFLHAGFRRDDAAYWSVLDELGVRSDRGQLDGFLEMCGVYLRDLFLLAHHRGGELTHTDRVSWFREQLPLVTERGLEAIAQELDKSYEYVSSNINVQLVMADLWGSLRAGNPA